MFKYIFVVACVSLLCSSCFDQCRNRAGAKEYEEISKGFKPNNSVAVGTFGSLNVEKQVDVFLYSKNCRDDPRIAPLLIKNGEAKVPVIVGRIEIEEKLWDKTSLVTVLIAINTDCKCIHKESAVIRRLEAISSKLEGQPNIDSTYKKSFDDSVKSLKDQLINERSGAAEKQQ